jgi:hypothetical protein
MIKIPTPTAIPTTMPTATELPPPTATLAPLPTATLAPLPTQADFGPRITESAGGFSYVAPTGWTVTAYSGSNFKVAMGEKTGNFTPNINFVEEANSDSLSSYIDMNMSGLSQSIPGAVVISLEDFTTNDGLQGNKVVIEDTQNGVKMTQICYFFDSGTMKVTAFYTRLVDQGQENDASVDQSMATFRFQ